MTTPTLQLHVSVYDADLRQPPHVHDELHLSLVLRGRLVETVGARSELAGPLSVVAKDPDVRHADAFGPEPVTMARLSLPAAGVESLLDAPDRAFAWRWTHDPAVARPFLRLLRRAHRLRPAAASARSRSLSDSSHHSAGDHVPPTLVAAHEPEIADLLAALTARPQPSTDGEPPMWLRDVVARVRDAWHPALRVRDLARQAQVHPVYLARCMRRWYGHGIAELLRQERLRAAATRLATERGSVSEVAHAMGFSDESHLCHAFAGTLGVTPGGFRTLAREVVARRGDVA